MNNKIDKRLWGVLGKQQTYYSPQQFLQGKTKIPLNASPFESWDAKRSKYNRVDGFENRIQQHGVVPQGTPIVPTPSPTPNVTPTPSSTPNPPSPTQTNTPTITPTPSSTGVLTYFILTENSDAIQTEASDNIEYEH